jgi:hypothetical protein
VHRARAGIIDAARGAGGVLRTAGASTPGWNAGSSSSTDATVAAR